MLFANLIGYFCCPFISGVIMDSFTNKIEGLVWGFRCFLYVGSLLIPFFFL